MTIVFSIIGFLIKFVVGLLGVVLLLLILLLVVPISIVVRYEQKQIAVKVHIFGIRIPVYPVPKWIEKMMKKKEDALQEDMQKFEEEQTASFEQNQKNDSRSSAQTEPTEKKTVDLPTEQNSSSTVQEVTVQETPPQKNRTNAEPVKEQPQEKSQSPSESPTMDKTPKTSDIENILKMLSAGKGALAIIMKGIWLSLWVRLPVQGADAADTAISFGKWNGWIGGVCAVLSNIMQFRLCQLDLIPDFVGEYKDQEMVQVKLTAVLFVGILAGLFFLKEMKTKPNP